MINIHPEIHNLIPLCYRVALAALNDRQLAIEITAKTILNTQLDFKEELSSDFLKIQLLKNLYSQLLSFTLYWKPARLRQAFQIFPLKINTYKNYSPKTKVLRWCLEHEEISIEELQEILDTPIQRLNKRLLKNQESPLPALPNQNTPFQEVLSYIQHSERIKKNQLFSRLSLTTILIFSGLAGIGIPLFLIWKKGKGQQQKMLENRYDPRLYPYEGKIYLKVFLETGQICTLKSLTPSASSLFKSIEGKGDLFSTVLVNNSPEASDFELFNFKLKQSFYFSIPGFSRIKQTKGHGTLIDFIHALSNHYNIPVELKTPNAKTHIDWHIQGLFPTDITKTETNLPSVNLQLLEPAVIRVQHH